MNKWELIPNSRTRSLELFLKIKKIQLKLSSFCKPIIIIPHSSLLCNYNFIGFVKWEWWMLFGICHVEFDSPWARPIEEAFWIVVSSLAQCSFLFLLHLCTPTSMDFSHPVRRRVTGKGTVCCGVCLNYARYCCLLSSEEWSMVDFGEEATPSCSRELAIKFFWGICGFFIMFYPLLDLL